VPGDLPDHPGAVPADLPDPPGAGAPHGVAAELRTAAAHVLTPVPEALERDDPPGPPLDPGDAHHLARVLRLRAGEIVTVTDGAGRWRRYRWRAVAGDRGRQPGTLATGLLEADGPLHVVAAPRPSLTVGFTPVKGDRPEWTVQKLTELGIDRIVPLRAARSVVRWDGARRTQQTERLRRVAREAAMQARRCHVPHIADLCAPGDVVGAAMAHFGGAPPDLDHPVVLVGPEGGWSDSELSAAPTVSLGPLVLRAETAAVAAGVLLGALRDHLVASEHATWSLR